MKTLRLLGTKPRSHPFPVVSWLIRLLEWSKISHVGVLFPEENAVFNANFNNIQFENIDTYTKRNKVIYNVEWEVTEEQLEILKQFRDERIGVQKGYFNTLFGAAIPHILRSLSFGLICLPNFCEKGRTCSSLFYEFAKAHGKVEALLVESSRISRGVFTTTDAVKLARDLS
jgi:hypothetical protein